MQGPGMVVNDELKDTIRSHLDLGKGNAKYTRKASKVGEVELLLSCRWDL